MSNEISLRQMYPAKMKPLPVQKTFVGIDFGTSTTVVSIASMDTNWILHCESIKLPQLLEDGAKIESELIPSVIAYFNGKPLVGEGASRLKYHLTSGKNIWFYFKMDLGTDRGVQYPESVLANKAPFNIRNPKDAARVFFMYLNTAIQNYCKAHGLSANIEYAVSIPASFEANQRKELCEALETNGMRVKLQSLIDEPNAAFISYAHESALGEKPLLLNDLYNPKVLVFDFGGGTCDISILEIGKSIHGVYSKNLAISRFTQLGGDDIDRYVACHYLLPRFLDCNGRSIKDYRTKELAAIARRLYKIAEQLKILINKKLAVGMSNFTVPTWKNSDEPVTVESRVSIPTRKGLLEQDEFGLSPAELTEAMRVFTSTSRQPKVIQGEEPYNNISIPINSAINKSGSDIDEIDYVLLIGGSAQSPYVQEALRDMFEESEILCPRDLQTHVSKGAAIHSLIMNGMGKCIIQPITSEPIIVVTKDNTNRVLFPAGTPIPCDIVTIDDLVTATDNQAQIELPICVGSPNKMLHNLVIEPPDSMETFPINTPVSLTVEIDADKILHISASCMGATYTVDLKNPYANRELSTAERIVFEAERQANIEMSRNHGTPSQATYRKLRNAYENAGNYLKAAETFEEQLESYPDENSYNNLGVMYGNAGWVEKAIEYYERALEVNPHNSYAHLNLATHLKYVDDDKYRMHIKAALEINPDEDVALIEAAFIDETDGRHTEARKKLEKAYGMMMAEWREGTLGSYGYGYLARIASKLGHEAEARKVRASRPESKSESYYDENNLTRTTSKQIKRS